MAHQGLSPSQSPQLTQASDHQCHKPIAIAPSRSLSKTAQDGSDSGHEGSSPTSTPSLSLSRESKCCSTTAIRHRLSAILDEFEQHLETLSPTPDKPRNEHRARLMEDLEWIRQQTLGLGYQNQNDDQSTPHSTDFSNEPTQLNLYTSPALQVSVFDKYDDDSDDDTSEASFILADPLDAPRIRVFDNNGSLDKSLDPSILNAYSLSVMSRYGSKCEVPMFWEGAEPDYMIVDEGSEHGRGEEDA